MLVAFFIGVLLWFMPSPPGLSVAGQHAMAVVIPTIILWITQAVPAAVSSIFMFGAVLTLMSSDIAPSTFLSFWESDTMWFILVCFIFGLVVSKSGLGKRLALYVFSLRRLIVVDLAFFGLNVLFSILGMATAFPKIVILFPLLISMASLSGLSKADPYVRHIALMINALANQTGILVYTGFVYNPVVASLGGFSANYITWIDWFFVPTLVVNFASFAVIYVLFSPSSSRKGFDPEVVRKERGKLGHLTSTEIKAIAWLGVAIALWSTADITGIPAGFSAVLVTGLLLMPGLGLIEFKEFIDYSDWNVIFFAMGILAIGNLSSTGFGNWLWSHILPNKLTGNPMLDLTAISFLVEILHVPLGSIGTTVAFAVPSISAYGHAVGMSNILLAFVTYLSITGQAFFVYQNATLAVGQAYGLWNTRDLLKFGIAMFFVLPITIGVLLSPWWALMGWL